MTPEEFWKIIAQSRARISSTRPEGNMQRQAMDLRRILVRLGPAGVLEFANLFFRFHQDAYRWDLWGAAHVIGGGCGDDAFSDFRSWLISMGRGTYESALGDPDSLADVVKDPSIESFFFESLFGVMANAFSELAGGELPERDVRSITQEPIGSRWASDEELRNKYPRLSAMFGFAKDRTRG